MSLGHRQREFTKAVGLLIGYAYSLPGVELTVGDAYRDPRVFGQVGVKDGYGSPVSVHKERLAIDLNLFVDDRYIVDSHNPIWVLLHLKWTALGGAKRIESDANHFSFDWQGRR